MSSETPQNAVNDQEEDGVFDAAFEEFSAPKEAKQEEEPIPSEAEATEEKKDEKPEEANPPEPSEAAPSEKPDGGEEPPKETKADDPWANATSEQLAEKAKLEKERDDFKHRAQSDANRVAALTRKLSTVGATAPAKTPEAEAKAAALEEAIKKLETEYPDIGATLRQIAEAGKDQLTPVTDAISEIATAAGQDVLEAETRSLDTLHPDWRTVAADPSFAGWAGAQPENIQRMVNSTSAKEVSVAIGLFKQERAQATGEPKVEAPAAEAKTEGTATATDAKREQQLEGGKDVRSKPAPAASGPPDDFEAAFEHFAAKKVAQAAGARR